MHRKSFLTEYLVDPSQLSDAEGIFAIAIIAATLILIRKMSRK